MFVDILKKLHILCEFFFERFLFVDKLLYFRYYFLLFFLVLKLQSLLLIVELALKCSLFRIQISFIFLLNLSKLFQMLVF